MQYEVTKDVGVTIGGKKYSHGSTVDTDHMAPKANADGLDKSLTENEKNDAIQKRQDGLIKQSQSDLDGHVKDGYLVPAGTQTKPASGKGAATATKEG